MSRGHHHHHHDDPRQQNRRRLALTLALTVSYMVAEVVGGLLSGSLALLADAGHMLSDAAALALALFAMWIAQRPPSARATYGYHRTEILAALANGAALVGVAVFILYEAIQRFSDPPEVRGGLLLAVAAGGLLVNLVALAILHGGKSGNLNMRGAWLHVLSDALGSVGAMASGGLILGFGWRWADPLASLLITVLVVNSAWALLKETVGVLMESAPGHLDVDDVRQTIQRAPDVKGVHDLHVWTLTSDKVCMSAHVVIASGAEASGVLLSITEQLRERFGIHHATIQMEDERFARQHCDDCEEQVAHAHGS
jgi:cobalt-zinc-cadmium efflux system protein